MTSVPGYIPGQDPSGSEFEGFANKAASVGTPIFPAKNEPQAAPGNGSLPPGATETGGFPTANKTTAKTTDEFVKTTVA
jgi:hypothetical protein